MYASSFPNGESPWKRKRNTRVSQRARKQELIMQIRFRIMIRSLSQRKRKTGITQIAERRIIIVGCIFARIKLNVSILRNPISKVLKLPAWDLERAKYVKFVGRDSKNASKGSFYDFLKLSRSGNDEQSYGCHCAKFAVSCLALS